MSFSGNGLRIRSYRERDCIDCPNQTKTYQTILNQIVI